MWPAPPSPPPNCKKEVDMKTCRKCSAGFEPTERQLQKGDYLCKSCNSVYMKSYRKARQAQGNPVRGGKVSAETRAKWNAEYYAQPAVKARRAELMRGYAAQHAERHAARRKVRTAIESGRMSRQPCEVCGQGNAHAHHDDYMRPLDVRWLCHPHHVDHHRNAAAKGEA
jgi:predicted  nucleic acid-binding Zn-ribbon protein